MSRRLTRWVIYVLIAIGFGVACVFLSHWQFERNESRAAQIELVEQNYDADPVPWPISSETTARSIRPMSGARWS